MPTFAWLTQFLVHAPSRCHEPRWFRYQPSGSISLVYVRRHSEPAHIGVCHIDSRIILQFFNTWKFPAFGIPWMFMYEVSSFLQLVPVQHATKLNMRSRFFKSGFVSALPLWVILVYFFIEFLEYAE